MILGILQHLMRNPGICERLREDLTTFSPNKKSMPTIYQLEGMPYFEAWVLFVRVLYGCHELYQEEGLGFGNHRVPAGVSELYRSAARDIATWETGHCFQFKLLPLS